MIIERHAVADNLHQRPAAVIAVDAVEGSSESALATRTIVRQ